MGVVIELEGEILFYLKGADNIMIERIQQRYEAIVQEESESLAREGLRTLVLAYKKLDINIYDKWVEKYNHCKSALVDRDIRLQSAVAELERDMDYLGITAVEDKLQNGVYKSIDL